MAIKPLINLFLTWKDEGGECHGRAWPESNLAINGRDMDLRAIRVERGGDGIARAVNPLFEPEVDLIHNLSGDAPDTAQLLDDKGGYLPGEWFIVAEPNA